MGIRPLWSGSMMFILDTQYMARHMRYGELMTVGNTIKCRSDFVKPAKIKGCDVWPRYAASTNQIIQFTRGQSLEFVKLVTVGQFISTSHDNNKNVFTDMKIVIYRYRGKLRLLTPGNINSLMLHTK